MIVPVIVPTRDEQGAPDRTIANVWDALYSLGQQPDLIHVSHVGYSYVRTRTFEYVKAKYHVNKVRGLMLDDDTLIKDGRALADCLKHADANNWNIVVPYMLKNGLTSLANTKGRMLSVDEANELNPWDIVPMAGLGFYYGEIPLNYKFHEGEPFEGEDLNFFYETQLNPHVAPLAIKHLKVMPL